MHIPRANSDYTGPQVPEHQMAKSIEDDDSPRWHIGLSMIPDLAEELARVVSLWSRLEHMMNGVICQLSGIGLNLGDVFLHNINMTARFLILESVATRYLKDKDPKLCSSLIKLSAKIRDYRKRNQLVHGLWQRGGMNFAVSSHSSRKDHKRENIRWTRDDWLASATTYRPSS